MVEDAPLSGEPPSAGQRAPGAEPGGGILGVLDPPDVCPPSAKPVAFRLLKPHESPKEISISKEKLSQRALAVDQAGFDLHAPLWRTSEVLSACLEAAAAEPSKWDSAAIEGLRKLAGRNAARWCQSNLWPILWDEALPVPLPGANSLGPSPPRLTRGAPSGILFEGFGFSTEPFFFLAESPVVKNIDGHVRWA
jgi:hypothetical protein